MKPQERYEILDELGRGGMATVYRARDRGLGRDVALKILRPDRADPSLVARMLREARTVAALDHPGIVRIHDVVGDDAQLFLVMELLSGRTFDRVLPQLALRDRVRMLAQVARAVHHAHQHGIVHRDLKPANIMIEPDGRVVVMDFGLARLDADRTRLTREDAAIGTPRYMAPEQIRGEAGGPATDVYAIGVMLYEGLARRHPFEGDTIAALYHRILAIDPVPPRRVDPRVPADLDTVCLRAIEKRPARRHPSAAHLADDLERWLAGQPITSRPPSVWSRIGRRPRALLLAGPIVLAVAAVALWLTHRRQSARLDKTRQALIEDMRRTSESCLEAALELRRAGNVTGMQKYAAQVEAVCRRVLEEAPRLAEAHYVWGRMLRAQQRIEEALAHQEEALAADPGHAGARYERGLLRAYQYQLLSRARDRASLPEDEQARALRERAAADLASSGTPAAEAMRAWLEGAHDRARPLLQGLLEQTAEFPEAYAALANIDLQEGRLEEAEDWLTRALARDRGHVRLLVNRAAVRENRGQRAGDRGQDPTAFYEKALADLAEALSFDRNTRDAWSVQAHVRVSWAGFVSGRGGDAKELYARAVEDAGEAVRLDPNDGEAWSTRGMARLNWGVDEAAAGRDPTDLLRAAIVDLEQTLRLDPKGARARARLGNCHANLAFRASNTGGDPTALSERALAELDEAIRLNPALDDALANRANVHQNLALWRMSRGLDPAESLRLALRDYDEAIRRNPLSDQHRSDRSNVHNALALSVRRHGGDPAPHHAAAVSDLDEALKLNPGRDRTWLRRAIARNNWALHRDARREDSEELYRAAIEDVGEAQRLNPRRDKAWKTRGDLRLNWASRMKADLRDPEPLYRGAQEDYDQAVRLNPAGTENWLGRAMLRLNWGIHVLESGLDPTELLADAISDCDETVRLNPSNAEAWTTRGSARGVRILALLRAKAPHDRLDEEYELQVRDLDEAIRLDPSSAESRHRRGYAHYAASRWTEALADFEEALRLNPAMEGQLRPLMQQCRERGGR